MFFDNDVESIFHPENILSSMCSSLDVTPYGLRSAPTHTEDGIPIRKIYVSNLPPKTTRTELFGVFAQYGFIKSCWLRMGEKGPNRTPTPTYAFITYSSPASAHKALQAPEHENMLRGRLLRISPADSWHQPAVGADGRVRWRLRGQRRDDNTAASSGEHDSNSQESSEHAESKNIGCSISTETEGQVTEEPSYTVLDILNRDCLAHILSYVPISDLIRSERVSKRWQSMIHDYFESIRTFKTSWWQHRCVTLTTAVLRRVLQRLGSLTRLHIDHHWPALNDRTAHTVGKFCPNLEELKVVGMHTKNWNPLIYGCKQLKSLSFITCNKLTDTSLVHIIKSDCNIESLTVANNTHVTGLFLSGTSSASLVSLAFYNCFSLQSTVLCSVIDGLPNLTTLKLDVFPETIWKVVPTILKNLPRLEELSLSEYSLNEAYPPGVQEFCEALSRLTDLKILNLSSNMFITNTVMKQIAQTCNKLHKLNISNCNFKKPFLHSGVTDEGILAVSGGCSALESLDVSYLAGLSNAGLTGVARLSRLSQLIVRGVPTITPVPFINILQSCPSLKEIDACGCDNLSSDLLPAAISAAQLWPRPLILRVGGTLFPERIESHSLVVVNGLDDRSNPNLRPDFIDKIIENGSEDSLEDYFDDHDDFDFDNDDDDFALRL